MSTKKPFCGVGKAPKGRRIGNMAECAELKQIRKYGETKIDPRTLSAAQNKGKIKETREQLIIQITGAKGAINRFKGRVDELEKKQARKELTDEENKKLKEYKSDLKKAETTAEKATSKLKKVLEKNRMESAKKTEKAKPEVKKPEMKKKLIKKVTGTKTKTAVKPKSKPKAKLPVATKTKIKTKTVIKPKPKPKAKLPVAKRTGVKKKAIRTKA